MSNERRRGRPIAGKSEFAKLLISKGLSLTQFCEQVDNLNKGGKVKYGVARSWSSGERTAPLWAKNWVLTIDSTDGGYQ